MYWSLYPTLEPFKGEPRRPLAISECQRSRITTSGTFLSRNQFPDLNAFRNPFNSRELLVLWNNHMMPLNLDHFVHNWVWTRLPLVS
eukprot:TCALIF_08085-PA protein Name:"Protein of unknown function" AED:0.09 eAED:0.09 QI:223/0.5/0.33/0.66/1/0.66/3/127/86